MADLKISALLASTTPLAGTEVLPIVQSNTTKQVSVANLTAGRAVSASSFQSTTNSGFGTSAPAKRVDAVATYRVQLDADETASLFGSGIVMGGDNGTNQSGAKVIAGYSAGGFGLHFLYSTNNQAGYASNPSLLTYAVGAKLTDAGDKT